MKVVLNSDVPKLGYRGDVVNVKDGYYRNFLLPRGFAEVATPSVLKVALARKEKKDLAKKQVIEDAEAVLKKLKGLSVTIEAKASDKGKLYGSVVEEDVIKAVKAEAKVTLDKEFVKMSHFKDLGDHTVVIHLGEGLEEKINVVVKALAE